jgi:hypothetical protein
MDELFVPLRSRRLRRFLRDLSLPDGYGFSTRDAKRIAATLVRNDAGGALQKLPCLLSVEWIAGLCGYCFAARRCESNLRHSPISKGA